MEEMVSIGKVARRFGVATQTIKRMVQRGELSALHIGRNLKFKSQDIDEFFNKSYVCAKGDK